MNETLIEFDAFGWRYMDREVPALHNVSCSIEAGECVGVVGPNEQGKTTLTRAMNGLIPYSYRGILEGDVRIKGTSIKEKPHHQLARTVGLVFSDPDSQFTSMGVAEELIFGLENLSLPRDEIGQRLEWITHALDLAPFIQKPPYELSGGQKQRVAIAAMLVMKPDILVLDEPTSMLDPAGKEEIFDILGRLMEDESLTLVVVEHNLEELVKLADRVLYVDEGTLQFDGPVQAFIDKFNHGTEKIYPPEVAQLFGFLRAEGHDIQTIPFLLEDGINAFKQLNDLAPGSPK